MSAGPASVTVTPGRIALVASVTVPLIAPVVDVTVCADATGTRQSNDRTRRVARRITMGISTPGSGFVGRPFQGRRVAGLKGPRYDVFFILDRCSDVRDAITSLTARYAMSIAASVCELPAASAL